MFKMKYINRKVTAWIAILAVLCQVLMPSIAQARSGSTDDHLTEICSAFGIKTVYLADGKSTPSPLLKFQAPHCAFCLSGPIAPPSYYVPAVAVIDGVAVVVPLVSTPNVKFRKLAAAPPRGPPFFAS
jgi:hypothetical protein